MKDITKSKWFKTRPEYVQEKILRYPPDGRYIYKPTGQIVTIYSYEEKNGKCETCKMIAKAKDSSGQHTEDRLVFGVQLKDLKQIFDKN